MDLSKKKKKREIGERLRELRIKRGMTMQEVAEKVNAYGSSVISNWEKGKTTPKPQFMQAYADFFNVSIDWIKYGDYDYFITQCISDFAEVLSGEKEELVELKNGLIVRATYKKTAYNEMYDHLLLYDEKIREKAKEQNIGYNRERVFDLIGEVISSTNGRALNIINVLEESFVTAIISCKEKGENIPDEIEQFADIFIELLDKLKKVI